MLQQLLKRVRFVSAPRNEVCPDVFVCQCANGLQTRPPCPGVVVVLVVLRCCRLALSSLSSSKAIYAVRQSSSFVAGISAPFGCRPIGGREPTPAGCQPEHLEMATFESALSAPLYAPPTDSGPDDRPMDIDISVQILSEVLEWLRTDPPVQGSFSKAVRQKAVEMKNLVNSGSVCHPFESRVNIRPPNSNVLHQNRFQLKSKQKESKADGSRQTARFVMGEEEN